MHRVIVSRRAYRAFIQSACTPLLSPPNLRPVAIAESTGFGEPPAAKGGAGLTSDRFRQLVLDAPGKIPVGSISLESSLGLGRGWRKGEAPRRCHGSITDVSALGLVPLSSRGREAGGASRAPSNRLKSTKGDFYFLLCAVPEPDLK
ncbi:hypothetical protein KM043_002944 [Ampulex compressa]|nr:hypothetical protein KM043_002944 [Ampulex compressa]